MDSSNKKTAAAVVIVLIVVLLFSWQYIGQEEEESSPMEGEWIVAESISMSVAATAPLEYTVDYPPENIRVEGDVLTMTGAGQSVEFAMVSDIEAVSMDYSLRCQLFLHGDVLYMFMVNPASSEEASGLISFVFVLTRDGLVTVDDDLPDMDGNAYGVVAELYNENNALLEETAISFLVEDQDMTALQLAVSAWDVEDKALGFLRTDGMGRVSIFCLTTSGAVFNIVLDNDVVTALTGVDSSFSPRYYVFDGQGVLSEDTYGLGDGTVIRGSGGVEYTVDAFYEDGRLCQKRADGSSSVIGVQAPGAHGAFAMVSASVAIVDVDGVLRMIDAFIFI